MITELDWRRLLKHSEKLCHYRNESVPVGQGKACFESNQQHWYVIFSNEIYSVDSMRCDHVIEVAKLGYDVTHRMWELYINGAEENSLSETEWLPHPVHFAHQDPLILLQAIEKDVEECIWR